MINFNNYICPNCYKYLDFCEKLKNCHFTIFRRSIPCFTRGKTSKITSYEIKQANKFYKNFLTWLFKTFKTNDNEFRKSLFNHLNFKKNQKILITGVGNGDDINFLIKYHKKYNLKIFAQDLSSNLLISTFDRFKKNKNIFFNISDAKKLPFKNNFFDHVFHFGGINLFGNYSKSIKEMERVSRVGGSITYGDEGIGNWLRNTIYCDMLINNNKLWKFKFNFKNISLHSKDLIIKYLLGNCFYLISYIYDPNYKNKFNYNVVHKSPKGGSILSRYIKKKNFSKKFILKNLNRQIN